MPEALARLVGMPRVDGGRDDGEQVGGCRQQQRLDVGPVERLDHSREEVGHAACGHDAPDEDELAVVGDEVSANTSRLRDSPPCYLPGCRS